MSSVKDLLRGDVVDGSGTANYVSKWSDADTITNSVIYDDGANVGLGTNSPSYKLTINTSDEDHIRLENGSELGFIRVLDSGIFDFWSHGDTNNEITFRNGSGSGTERMRIDSSGRVGIGTSSPYSKVTIHSTASSTLGLNSQTGLVLGQGGSTSDIVQIGFNQALQSTHSPASIGYVITNASASTYGDLVFGTRNVNTDTAPTERMRIDGSGQVIVGPFGGNGNAVVAGSSAPSVTNQPGTNLLLKSGDGSGTGSSFISFSTSPSGSSGTTVNTAVERMRILSSGGITFNGDTAAANALDDYEEGTWTPIDASGAGLTLVSAGVYTKIGRQVFYSAQITYPSTASGSNAIIGGLPFTVANNDQSRGGNLSYSTTASASYALLSANTTQVVIVSNTGGNVTNATVTSAVLWITGHYPV
jgi:hypothetical protein